MIEQIILTKPLWPAKVQAIAAIIAALGGVAAFWRLITKNKQQEAQISELSKHTEALNKQVDVLREQLFLTYKPWIKPGMAPAQSDGSLSLTLNNFGKPAVIKSIDVVEGDVKLLNDSLNGYEFEKQLKVHYSLEEFGDRSNISFKLKLIYKDLRGITYEMIIQLNGDLIEILEENVINNIRQN